MVLVTEVRNSSRFVSITFYYAQLFPVIFFFFFFGEGGGEAESFFSPFHKLENRKTDLVYFSSELFTRDSDGTWHLSVEDDKGNKTTGGAKIRLLKTVSLLLVLLSSENL